MPKDNISRAINKSEINKSQNFQNLRYEGFGPKKIALIIETLTDNKNRTAGKIRTTLQKFGGTLGTSGSTIHFFNNCGVIQISGKLISEEKALEIAARVSATDCITNSDFYEIITKKDNFYKAKNEFQKYTKNLIYSAIEWRPKDLISFPRSEITNFENMYEILQEDDDIQSIFHNCKYL